MTSPHDPNAIPGEDAPVHDVKPEKPVVEIDEETLRPMSKVDFTTKTKPTPITDRAPVIGRINLTQRSTVSPDI